MPGPIYNMHKSMSHTAQAAHKSRGGRSNGRHWSLRWFPSATETRLHFKLPLKPYDNNGSMDPFKIGYHYYVKQANKGRGTFIIHQDGASVIEAYANPQAYGLEIPPNPSLAKCRKEMFIAVSGWIEEPFHKIQQKGKDGNMYWNRVPCDKRTCEHCKNGAPKVFGNRFYTNFSYGLWHAVFEPLMERVQQYCKCGGILCIHDYRCEKCGHVLVDFLNKCAQCGNTAVALDIDNGMAVCQKCGAEWSTYPSSNPDVMEMVSHPSTCQNCKHTEVPVPNLNCVDPGQCQNKADPYTLWDIQMTIVKRDDRTEITGWDIKEPDVRLFDPKFQGGESPDEEERKAAEAVAKRNQEDLDLNEIMAQLSPSEQAQLIGVENPFASGAARDDVKFRQRTESYDA